MDEPPEYVYSYDDDTVDTADLTNLQMDDDDDDEKLIIALDFGTTYSGVAYATTTNPEKIYLVEEWPGARGRAYAKCPTVIQYDDAGSYRWGYELDKTASNQIEAIKLLLDPDQPKPTYIPAVNTEAELRRLGKTAISVATDYIGAILRHALEKIESRFARNYVKLLKKQYVLSVPAVWSDKAQEATLRAARQAGIQPVRSIKEPEAAALCTIHELGDKGLRIGDAITLCDAGGGTVDLISYKIANLRPFKLAELTSATGGLAGSLILNRRFEKWVESVVGEQVYFSLKETDAYRRAMKDFDESIKPGFHSRTDENCYVNFPKANLVDDPAQGLECNTLTVAGETMYDIYEPLIREINNLVTGQVEGVREKRLKDGQNDHDNLDYVFLVGGFGANNYLFEQIEEAHPEVEVMRPNNAWSAIVRGAVMSMLPTMAQVVTNIAPRHYGVSAMSNYEEERDRGFKRIWHLYDEVHKVKIMTWYIEKGDDLLRARKIEFDFSRAFRPNPSHDDLQIVDELLECPLDVAPTHPSEGVKTNCVLRTDLSTIPVEHFKKKRKISLKTGKLIEWWELHFKLLVTVQSGPMLFSIECGGKEYGQCSTEY